MITFAELVDRGLVVCPRCTAPVRHDGAGWVCGGAGCTLGERPFPEAAGVPALIDFDVSVVSRERLIAADGASELGRADQRQSLRDRVGSWLHPTNHRAEKVARRLSELVHRGAGSAAGSRPRVLVVGGGAIGNGLGALYEDPGLDVIGFDVYASPITTFVADGHRIPLADGSVDAVVVQAVLEHVLEPHVVAAQIHRVLRPGGIVYADTPFLQPVHEGPYDFTRFTESGHRYLFRGFELIESGVVAGAGTQLAWSIEHFVRALTRSVVVGRLAHLGFAWLSRLDRFLDPRHSLDSASSVYFLGSRAETDLTPGQILEYYQGAQ